MTSHAIKTLFVTIFLALGWSGQVFAFACVDFSEGSHKDEMSMGGHEGHDMARGHDNHPCDNCDFKNQCNHDSLHCLKGAEKDDAFVVAKKTNPETITGIPAETLQFRTRHNQIRGPDKSFTQNLKLNYSLISLRVRLQV